MGVESLWVPSSSIFSLYKLLKSLSSGFGANWSLVPILENDYVMKYACQEMCIDRVPPEGE